MEFLESGFVRPRQARYQAALRPDMKCEIHSNALSNFTPSPSHAFYPRLCTNCARTRLLHRNRAQRIRQYVSGNSAISLVRRLSFSRASRFICNFIVIRSPRYIS